MKLLVLALALLLVIVAVKTRRLSFAATPPAAYQGTGPAFDLTTHLNGTLEMSGMVFGPTGRMTSAFTGRMEGTWQDDTGTLTEYFTYDTGRQQVRQWQITPGPDGTFTATAEDVIGTAEGIVIGSAVRLRYRIVLPPDAGGHRLNAIDWMFLMPDGSILNRSELRMFGIKVGELQAVMRPITE